MQQRQVSKLLTGIYMRSTCVSCVGRWRKNGRVCDWHHNQTHPVTQKLPRMSEKCSHMFVLLICMFFILVFEEAQVEKKRKKKLPGTFFFPLLTLVTNQEDLQPKIIVRIHLDTVDSPGSISPSGHRNNVSVGVSGKELQAKIRMHSHG